MFKTKKKSLILAISLTLFSAVLLSTASYAWFAMNTKTNANDFKVEAYSDSLFLQISGTNNDADFSTNPYVHGEDTEPLRLVTHKVISDTDNVFSAVVATPASGNYDKTTHTKNYYKLADSDAEGAFATGVYNYILATEAGGDFHEGSRLAGYYKNIVFDTVLSGNAQTGTDYYEQADGRYKKVTLSTTESAKGYYTVKGTLASYAASDESFKSGDTGVYWKADGTTGDLSIVAGLKPGTDMSAFYTVETVVAGDEFDGTTTYYVKSGDDYICIGKPEKDTPMIGYIYWGRSYSSDLDDAQEENTLNVLSPDAADEDYYLTKTLYLRQAAETNHADNLRISGVEVTGASNVMNPALRVLFVARSSVDPSDVVTTVYDVGAKKFDVASDGTGGTVDFVLFSKLLGDKQETVTVDVYIYFDGTDEISKNTTLAGGVLNGQSVSIEFSIDELDYNEVS